MSALNDDRNFLEKTDDALQYIHGLLAENWQERTYRPKKDLELKLYGGSALLLAGVSVIADTVIGKSMGLFSSLTMGFIYYIHKNDPSHGLKYTEQWPLLVGMDFLMASAAVRGVLEIAYGIAEENYRHVQNGAEAFLMGLGGMSGVAGAYVERTDIGPPPKRSSSEKS